jgi:hypothetical protein
MANSSHRLLGGSPTFLLPVLFGETLSQSCIASAGKVRNLKTDKGPNVIRVY